MRIHFFYFASGGPFAVSTRIEIITNCLQFSRTFPIITSLFVSFFFHLTTDGASRTAIVLPKRSQQYFLFLNPICRLTTDSVIHTGIRVLWLKSNLHDGFVAEKGYMIRICAPNTTTWAILFSADLDQLNTLEKDFAFHTFTSERMVVLLTIKIG